MPFLMTAYPTFDYFSTKRSLGVEIDLLQIKLLNLLEIVEYEDTFCFW